MVFRCTIETITATTVTLSLRNPQTNARVFLKDARRPWAVEHDFFESSFAGLYRGLYAFLSAPKERRDLLLLQRQPVVDNTITTLNDSGHGPFADLVLRVKRAKDFFIIIGPPGTGKTSYGLMTTLKEELTADDTSVLLMAYTNRAVDEICDKLIDEGIDFLRVGGRFTASERSRSHLLCERVKTVDSAAGLRSLLMGTRVFVGTTTALSSSPLLFRHKQFSLAIIDEASQILEPHLLALFSAMHGEESAIRKFVMIGDHKQLPAVVQQTQRESAVSEPSLRGILLTDCRLSLFERLLKRYRHDPEVVYMFTRQGRMHDDIALFPNIHFYGGLLSSVPLPHQTEQLPVESITHPSATHHRVAFIDVAPPADSLSDKVNQAEAEVIARAVHHIYKSVMGEAGEAAGKVSFDADATVGVIVPYRNQIAAVRTAIERYGIAELSDITIDTVERYQGSQRDHIIYGFTVSKSYQLRFLTDNVFEEDGLRIDRKLNVAMTRARKHLLLVGDAELLREDVTFAALIDFCREEETFFSRR